MSGWVGLWLFKSRLVDWVDWLGKGEGGLGRNEWIRKGGGGKWCHFLCILLIGVYAADGWRVVVVVDAV